VPALVVSPWVEAGAVSHTLFDHTSIIKTVLLRFCAEDLAPWSGLQKALHWSERSPTCNAGWRRRPRTCVPTVSRRATPSLGVGGISMGHSG
jgi:hypothetical protein